MKFRHLLLFLLLTIQAHADDALPITWEVGDGEGGTFLIKLYEGHLARTSYSKGPHGYLGEMGSWHRDGHTYTVIYDSGWCDIITKQEDGSYAKRGYKPNSSLNGAPSNSSVAKLMYDKPLFQEIPREKFVGVWKLHDENDEIFYLETKADGTARSSYAGGIDGVFGETGVWRHEGNRILIAYNDGWVDIIVYGDDFDKYSYGPGQVLAGKFNNISTAEKVAPKEAGVQH